MTASSTYSGTTGATLTVNDGSTELTAITISNEAALRKVGSGADSWGPDKHYRQTQSITLNGNWTPIGIAEQFTGSYNGGGLSISNLNIPSAIMTSLGLFASIGEDGAVVEVT